MRACSAGLNNRLVHGYQLGAVGEAGFYLDVGDHLGDAVHYVGTGQHAAAFAHELRNRFAISRAFHNGGADQGHGLGIVELEAARLAPLGQQSGGEDQQLIFFAGSQFHSAFDFSIREG